MGFNYLQTDDRDDYLAQFGRKTNPNKQVPISFTLINSDGTIVLKEVPRFAIKKYARKTYCVPSKYVWRKILEEKGYRIINNY